MKKLLSVSILIMCFNLCHAQTWAEWFQQKQTQKKYLIEQIAALQVYLGYAKKGYDIASKGIHLLQGDVDDLFMGFFKFSFQHIPLPRISDRVEAYHDKGFAQRHHDIGMVYIQIVTIDSVKYNGLITNLLA